MIKKNFKKVHDEYHNLLNKLTTSPDGRQEELMHKFLENRTLLLPGQNGMRSQYHHGPFSSIFFSKLPLNGSFRRVPDFVFVTKTSVQATVVFIEIEDPSKKYFTGSDDFTSSFNQAYQQLEDWKIWFEGDANKSLLRSSLNEAIRHSMMINLPLKAEFVLIYGRSNEFQDQQNKIRRLAEKTTGPYFVMSYDRLHCDHFHSANITVRRDDNGFYATSVDEDYLYNQITHSRHYHIRRKIEAVQSNPYKLTSEKASLINQITLLDSMSPSDVRAHFLKLKSRMH